MISKDGPRFPSPRLLQPPFRRPGEAGTPGAAAGVDLFYVECRTCGFEPADRLMIPRGPCPKCHAGTWWRLPRPGALLYATNRPLPGHQARF